jgi:ELWxxDGT repeat protein
MLFEALEDRTLLTANASVVKDIDPRVNGYTYQAVTATSDKTFFLVHRSGYEMWSTDGTDAGTVRLTSYSLQPYGLTAIGGILYYSAIDTSRNLDPAELWRSDGTVAGTYPLTSFAYQGSSVVSITDAGDGSFYFLGNQGRYATELWKSDGTVAGTVRITSGDAPSYLVNPSGSLLVSNGNVFFAGFEATHGKELWRSDGTTEGTRLVADVVAGTGSSSPANLRAVGGRVLFTATDAAHGNELWTSDGNQGATLLADINPGSGGSTPANLTVAGNTLYLTANDGTHGMELWKTDGTTGGTAMVADIASGAAGSAPTGITPLGPGGSVVFAAADATGDRELWRSDGTAAGTSRVRDNNAGTASSAPSSIVSVGDWAYFSATNAQAGRELWKTDGTAGGTVRVKDINPGIADSSPGLLSANGSKVYFVATDAMHGTQVWSSDGTDAGTGIAKVIVYFPYSSDPKNFSSLGGLLLFKVAGALWRSDGTELGTFATGLPSTVVQFWSNAGRYLLLDSSGGSVSLERTDLTASGTTALATFAAVPQLLGWVGDTVYFGGRTGAGGNSLWKSDGTVEGTVRVLDVNTSATPSEAFVAVGSVGDRVVFAADDGVHGRELWVSDGTAAGTALLKDIVAGTDGVAPSNISQIGDRLVFELDDGVSGTELWVSDGTAAGTHLLKDINPGAGSSSPQARGRIGDEVFFAADDGVHGVEFWVTDGTADGTVLLKDINRGGGSSATGATSVGYLGGRLLFVAQDTNSVYGLWVTDGTLAGTSKVSDSGGVGISPMGQFVTSNGLTYFLTPSTLWKTDGTAAGTAIVKAFSGAQQPKSIWVAGDQVVIVTGKSGSDVYNTVWYTDGTGAGTVLIPTVPAGDTLSEVAPPVVVADTLFFAGRGAALGVEPRMVATDILPAAPSALTATVVTGGEIRLGWQDNSDKESGFRIERSSSPSFSTIDQTVTVLPDVSEYDDQGLAYNTTYYYRVAAYNAGGSSAPASTSQTTNSIPLRPTGATAVPATATAITFTWTDNADNEQGYTVQRSTSPTFASVDLSVSLAPGTTSFADTGLANDATYYYRVWAYNAGAASPAASASAHTPKIPDAPSDLVAVAVSGGEIDLTWSDGSNNETGFLIQRSATADFSAGVATLAAPPNATSLADRDLSVDTTYYYRLTSVNGVASSSSVSATAHTPAAPLPPGNLTINPQSGDRVTLTWTDNASAESGYRVDRSTAPDFSSVQATFALPADSTTLTDTGTAKLTTYYYRVYAYNAQGNSLDARASVATPDLAAVNLIAKGVSAQEVDLQWDDRATTETSYRIERAPVGGQFVTVVTTAANYTTYQDRNLSANTSYLYRVVAVTPAGLAFSGAASARTSVDAPLSVPLAQFPKFNGSDSKPDWLTTAGNFVYFVVNGATSGGPGDLWRTDGTSAGTILLRSGVQAQRLFAVGDTLYFNGYDTSTGWELWKSRGTPETTGPMIDVLPGTSGSNPMPLATIGETFFFTAYAADGSSDLWRSDGTVAGTFKLASGIKTKLPGVDVRVGAAVLDGFLYFAAAPSGNQLYKTDGTVAGTSLITSIGDSPYSFTAFGNAVYFFAFDTESQGWAFWKTDGTAAGTGIVKTLYNGVEDPPFNGLTVFKDKLFFSAPDPAAWIELFTSDGTAQGTGLFKDLVPGSGGSSPGGFTQIGDLLYFVAASKIWTSDGTVGGTAAFRPEGFNASDAVFYEAGGSVFFVDWPWLWQTDGTFPGTVQTATLKGTTVNTPQFSGRQAAVLGDRIFFSVALATGDARELRVAYGTPPAAPTSLNLAPPPPEQSGGVGLVWSDAASTASAYVIQRSATADFATVDATLVAAAGTTSYNDATAAPGASYFYRIAAVNAGGQSAYSNVVFSGPPRVLAATFDYGGSADKLTIGFSSDVAADLTAGDFTVTNLTSGQVLASTDLLETYDSTDNVATLTYAGAGKPRLPDGRYRLLLHSAGVANTLGLALDGDQDGTAGEDFEFDFFQMAGDANRDARVDFNDLVALAQNYNGTGTKTWAEGDFTGDGAVDFNDLVFLAQRYNTSLPASGPVAQLAAAPMPPLASVIAQLDPSGGGTVGPQPSHPKSLSTGKAPPLAKRRPSSHLASGQVPRSVAMPAVKPVVGPKPSARMVAVSSPTLPKPPACSSTRITRRKLSDLLV